MLDHMQLSFTIHKPVDQVFEAIVLRKHLRNYFASDPDADLIAGKTVNWGFEDVGRVIPVDVLRLEPEKLNEFSWSPIGWKTTVQMYFE